jgi:hypothetical protein
MATTESTLTATKVMITNATVTKANLQLQQLPLPMLQLY